MSDGEASFRERYREKEAVLAELRKVLEAVRGADKYSKVVAQSILDHLARIEAEQREVTRKGGRAP